MGCQSNASEAYARSTTSQSSVACVYSRSVPTYCGSTSFRPLYFGFKDQQNYVIGLKNRTEPRRRAMTISQNSYSPSLRGDTQPLSSSRDMWHTLSGTPWLAHDFRHGKAEPVLSEALILIIATTAFLRPRCTRVCSRYFAVTAFSCASPCQNAVVVQCLKERPANRNKTH